MSLAWLWALGLVWSQLCWLQRAGDWPWQVAPEAAWNHAPRSLLVQAARPSWIFHCLCHSVSHLHRLFSQHLYPQHRLCPWPLLWPRLSYLGLSSSGSSRSQCAPTGTAGHRLLSCRCWKPGFEPKRSADCRKMECHCVLVMLNSENGRSCHTWNQSTVTWKKPTDNDIIQSVPHTLIACKPSQPAASSRRRSAQQQRHVPGSETRKPFTPWSEATGKEMLEKKQPFSPQFTSANLICAAAARQNQQSCKAQQIPQHKSLSAAAS